MTNETELKPCPFCGEIPEIVEPSGFYKKLYCINCDCDVYFDCRTDTKEVAINLWNKRKIFTTSLSKNTDDEIKKIKKLSEENETLI